MSKVYAVADSARAAMARAAAEARRAMDHGIEKNGLWYRVSLEQAREMYWSKVRTILREAHIEVDPDRNIAIQCPDCKKVTVISGSVKTFNCHCSPHEERYAFQCRHIDLRD